MLKKIIIGIVLSSSLFSQNFVTITFLSIPDIQVLV